MAKKHEGYLVMTEEKEDNIYSYIERDGTEVTCRSKAEWNVKWRERYLENCGLSYPELIGLKGQTVTLQILGGRYYDQNVSESNYIEVLDLFMPIEIKQVTFELDDGLEVIVDVGPVKVPIQRHGSDRTIKKVKVIWAGIQVTPENIFEWTEEGARLDKTYNPVIEIQVTPNKVWDESTSEMYMLEGAIELPNGRLIGG